MKRLVKRASMLTFVLVLFMSITGCAEDLGEQYIKNDFVESLWGIAIEEFNCPIDFPTDTEIVAIADQILDGKMIVLYSMDNMLEYNPDVMDTFDWNVQYSNTPNTFQLYLQCLNPIAYLAKSYEITTNEDYLLQAQKILESWLAYKNDYANQNPFLWYDHGTALRSETLIYYALVMQKAGKADEAFRQTINNLLTEHAEFLANAQNYTANHNHGIFQDRALIYIAYFLDNKKSEEWLALAKERLNSQHDYAFNIENVHVENSPGYAYGVMELFLDISNFLSQFDDSYGEDLHADIYGSAEFMSWMVKPNGTIAEIGDTNSIPDYEAAHSKDLSQYGNKHLIYASTLGASGEQPDSNSCIYPVSGYYFSRSSWSSENFPDSTWCMFKAGYSSKTHKHADDCSFMLYSKGYDIFVDPGWYNYVSGDKYRDYFVSSNAHNTVIADGKTYSPTAENSTKTGILEASLTDEYDYVLGFNSMYKGVEIDRHFYCLGDAIILYDDIEAEEEHEYSQLFQLSESVEILSHSDTEVILALADTGYTVRIRQIGAPPNLDIISGSDETDYGHISRTMGLLDTTTTLKFDMQCSSGSYITVITIEDKDGYIELKQNGKSDTRKIKETDIVYDNANEMIVLDTISLPLQSRKHFDLDDVVVQMEGDTLTTDSHMNRGDLLYAYYLVDKQTATPILKSDYAESPVFSCTVPQGEYLLKVYVKAKNGQRKSAMIAEIANIAGDEAVLVSDGSLYNLDYKGQTMEQIDESTYRFAVDFDYSWNFNIKWYIYRNGGYYTSLNSSEKDLIYSFEEPGSYTVMYYLTTPNGDNEFWNFPIIDYSVD